MKTCILITNRDPFNFIGSFLEEEIKQLSFVFDKVYCVSIDASKKSVRLRPVPDNITIFPLGNSHSKIKYLLYSLAGIISPSKDLKIKSKSIRRILTELYCRGRAKIIYKQILRRLDISKLKDENVSVYSFWFSYQAISAWLLKDKLKKAGINVLAVSRAHGYDLYHYRNPAGFLPFQDVSIKNLNGVYPCSDNGAEYLKGLYPELSGKIKTARLGTADYGLGNTESKEFNNPDKLWVFLTCCNFKPLKRMPLFAKAFVRLCEQTNCKWICVGAGAEFQTVKDIINEHGKQDFVWFTGEIENSELMKIYKNNRVSYFCNVSTTEGVPVSVMEALSFGIPVIATDVGGTGELVNQSVGALISSDIDENLLYDILKQNTNIEEKEYIEKRKAARKVWEASASAENNYNAWCKEII